MQFIRAKDFKAERAWGRQMLAQFGDVAVKLHWTDQAFVWHQNTGAEVFIVLDGTVDMYVRQQGEERMIQMLPGDMISFAEGNEHKAVPQGEARIVVAELMTSA